MFPASSALFWDKLKEAEEGEPAISLISDYPDSRGPSGFVPDMA